MPPSTDLRPNGCAVAGCDRQARAKGYCNACYKRLVWRPQGGAAVERERAASRSWKANNAGACIDCGTPTTNHDGTPFERCTPCSQARLAAIKRDEAKARALSMAELRSQGLTNREIAERTGEPVYVVANVLSRARKVYGIDVPRDPYMTNRREALRAA